MSRGRRVVVVADRVVFEELGAVVVLPPSLVKVVADGAESHDASNIAAHASDARRRIMAGWYAVAVSDGHR